MKRICQFIEWIFSLLLLLIFAPLLVLLALLVKTTSNGPAFFLSPRIGYQGRRFFCYKLRSMRCFDPNTLHDYFDKQPEKKFEWDLNHKLKTDPRVTRLGRFLRKSSLDELPQIINVLQGTMSLVGPRPLLESELDLIPAELKMKFLSIKPGITGLWQVSGRSAIAFSDRIKMESAYIDKKNWFLDLKILLKTLPVVLLRKGAY